MYCGLHQCKTSELGFNDCLISDISKVLAESGCAQKFFASNYIGSSSNIRDTIRSMSFPYLRRCALLWKLLYPSSPAPFCDRNNLLGRSSFAINDMMDDGSLVELNEIQKLENMFKIPSLDVVLKEEVLRSLVLKWFYHFHKEFERCSFGGVMHVKPAVPFKLMHLPHLYQDLLQRFVLTSPPQISSQAIFPSFSSSWKFSFIVYIFYQVDKTVLPWLQNYPSWSCIMPPVW